MFLLLYQSCLYYVAQLIGVSTGGGGTVLMCFAFLGVLACRRMKNSKHQNKDLDNELEKDRNHDLINRKESIITDTDTEASQKEGFDDIEHGLNANSPMKKRRTKDDGSDIFLGMEEGDESFMVR